MLHGSPWAAEEGGSIHVGDFEAQAGTPHANPSNGVCLLHGFLGVLKPTPVVLDHGRTSCSPQERSSPMAQRRGGADRRRGERGLIGQVFDEADHALRRRMQLKTAGALHSRRPPTEQPNSAAWNVRPLPARFSVSRAGFLYKKPF